MSGRIVVPYTPGKLRPETVAALKGFDVDYVGVGDRDDAYYELLRELWEAGKSFAIIEQDIVPRSWQLDELLGCFYPWCGAYYEYEGSGLTGGLGFTQFSSELLARLPGAMRASGEFVDREHPRRHWCSVDDRLNQVLLACGLLTHVHGVVRHLNPQRSSHGCTVETLTGPPLDVIREDATAVLAAGERLWASGPSERPALKVKVERLLQQWMVTDNTVRALSGGRVDDCYRFGSGPLAPRPGEEPLPARAWLTPTE
jgi:hypothetical protein